MRSSMPGVARRNDIQRILETIGARGGSALRGEFATSNSLAVHEAALVYVVSSFG